MFRKMPIILLVLIAAIVILFPWLSPTCKSALYGVSLSLKSLIVFVLPFLIFGLLFKTAMGWAKKASKWVFGLLGIICVSNFTSTMVSYLAGSLAYQFDLSVTTLPEAISLIPLGDLTLPRFIGNSQAMLAALVLGMLFGWISPAKGEKISCYLEKMVSYILKSILYVIPFFIVGFVVKMIHDGVLGMIFQSYLVIFALVAIAVFTYIGFLYLAANGFQYKACKKSLKDLFPAAIAGFGSMSSVAAMPLTLLGVEKNAKNPDVSRSIIPVTVNIHLIGDCFAIPIFAFAILKSFGVEEPSCFNYIVFAFYFVLAKFSVAAVPGGGILVMLPILETYLGFNGEMLSLITTLYILFDPLITSANILGNGAFALGIGNRIKKTIADPV
ncbi:MAG: cation:dicarboxylase symporter family transporter [Chlamydiota bacterium]